MASRLVKAPAVQARRTFAAQVKDKRTFFKTRHDGVFFNQFDMGKKLNDFFDRLLWHRLSGSW